MISIKKIIIIFKCFKDIINKQQQSFDLDFRVAIKKYSSTRDYSLHTTNTTNDIP